MYVKLIESRKDLQNIKKNCLQAKPLLKSFICYRCEMS